MKQRESLAEQLERMRCLEGAPGADNPYRLAADVLCGPGVNLKYSPHCLRGLRQVGKWLERLLVYHGTQLHPELGAILVPPCAPLRSMPASAVPAAPPFPTASPPAIQPSALALDTEKLRAIEAETKAAVSLVSEFLSRGSTTAHGAAVSTQSRARSA